MAILRSLLVLYFFCVFLNSKCAIALSYNIVSFGAKADGKSDSTHAFQKAWANACGSIKPASIYVPQGRFYLQSGTFNGPCKNNAIFIRIDGTLVAPFDYRVIGSSPAWIMFKNVDGVTISGGILDGQGTSLWACKNGAKTCPTGASVCKIIKLINQQDNRLLSL